MTSSILKNLADAGIDCAAEDLRLFAETNNSRLYLLTSSNTPGPLILKSPSTGSPQDAIERVEAEYDSLSKLYGDDSETALCPKPYDMLLSSGILAMEYVEAPSLRECLQDSGLATDKKLDLLGSAGACVNTFHDRFSRTAEIVSAPDLLGRVREAIVDSPGWAAAAKNFERLSATAHLVDGAELDVSVRHGDCKIDNFLCPESGIQTIDVVMTHQTFRLADLSYFLNSLSMAFLEPRLMRQLPLRKRAEAAFLEGYGYPTDRKSRDRLLWFRQRSMLLFWSGYTNPAGPKRLYFWLINRMIYRYLQQEMQGLGSLRF